MRSGAAGDVPELVGLVNEIFQVTIDEKSNRVVVTTPDAERLRTVIENDSVRDLVTTIIGTIERDGTGG